MNMIELKQGVYVLTENVTVNNVLGALFKLMRISDFLPDGELKQATAEIASVIFGLVDTNANASISGLNTSEQQLWQEVRELAIGLVQHLQEESLPPISEFLAERRLGISLPEPASAQVAHPGNSAHLDAFSAGDDEISDFLARRRMDLEVPHA